MHDAATAAAEAAADLWVEFLQTCAASLLDTGMEPAKARETIQLSVELADLALKAYDERWPGVV